MRVHSSATEDKINEFLALPILPYSDSEKFYEVRNEIAENVLPELEEILVENKEAMKRTIENSDVDFYGDILAMQHNVSILAENMRILKQVNARLSAISAATERR